MADDAHMPTILAVQGTQGVDGIGERYATECELGASEATIGIILRRLKSEGLIVGEGNTRGMVYKLGKQE